MSRVRPGDDPAGPRPVALVRPNDDPAGPGPVALVRPGDDPAGPRPVALVRLGIRVRAEEAEPTFARLEDVLAAGAEERELDGAVEYATYGEPGALPGDARLRELAGDALLGVSRTPVAGGWATAYQAHLTRVTVGELAVRPPWVAGEPGDLVIDPGDSFGGGHHVTTQLCLELLQELEPGGALCDWGTGSGVLAIAAARLGWAPVYAVDLGGGELVAANARANGVEVEFERCDVTREPAPPAATAVANLTAPLLRAALEVQPRPRALIASGLLAAEAAAWDGGAAAGGETGTDAGGETGAGVGGAGPPAGPAVRARRERDGWAAVLCA
ncbi:MAG TPA: 50S ribosomal protein L11 methyltransferase [Solirubrobacteraceae bacterium]